MSNPSISKMIASTVVAVMRARTSTRSTSWREPGAPWRALTLHACQVWHVLGPVRDDCSAEGNRCRYSPAGAAVASVVGEDDLGDRALLLDDGQHVEGIR